MEEDTGLSHSRVRADIAEHFMSKKDYARAEPYALAAAESGAGWALLCAGECERGLKKWEEANGFYQAAARRYGRPAFDWYFTCRATGKMDREAAVGSVPRLPARLRPGGRGRRTVPGGPVPPARRGRPGGSRAVPPGSGGGRDGHVLTVRRARFGCRGRRSRARPGARPGGRAKRGEVPARHARRRSPDVVRRRARPGPFGRRCVLARAGGGSACGRRIPRRLVPGESWATGPARWSIGRGARRRSRVRCG